MKVFLSFLLALALAGCGANKSDEGPLTFPDDPDGLVLTQLVQAGSDLQKPHLISYYLYVPSKPAAEGVCLTLAGRGYETEVQPPAVGADWLCLVAESVIPSHATLLKRRRGFEQLVAMHGGQYDGWETRVER